MPPAFLLQAFVCVQASKEFDNFRNNSGPSCLVAGTQSRTIVAMEILIKENIITPMGVILELLRTAIDRPFALFISQEDAA